MPLVIRPAEATDDAAIVALIAPSEPDVPPLSPEEFRAGADRSLRAGTGEQWVAELDGTISGEAHFSHAWWTHISTVYLVEVRVAVPHRNQGIGSTLHERLLGRLTEHGATTILVWLLENDAESRRFAERRGYVPAGEVIEECRLELSDAQLDSADAITRRLREQGIHIASLSEPGLATDGFLRAVQRVSAGGAEASLTLDAWRAATLDAPGCSPETYWVAIHNGTPVGLTFLKRLSAVAAENDYTGVLPEYQGRGIARALKAHAIEWGRANGLRSFHTSSQIENHRMITINYGLGYVPGARRIGMTREV